MGKIYGGGHGYSRPVFQRKYQFSGINYLMEYLVAAFTLAIATTSFHIVLFCFISHSPYRALWPRFLIESFRPIMARALSLAMSRVPAYYFCRYLSPCLSLSFSLPVVIFLPPGALGYRVGTWQASGGQDNFAGYTSGSKHWYGMAARSGWLIVLSDARLLFVYIFVSGYCVLPVPIFLPPLSVTVGTGWLLNVPGQSDYLYGALCSAALVSHAGQGAEGSSERYSNMF
ncbi:hypothetical protein BDP27DRAFT_842176 [Rhodocollybia butyracea]|uniref:Uncharacterized protein n=1 Tax=Rhodocollybia butyracea TaxID=206335 RepID=A0A9P5P614_9AGAR|nr:hypothetical protein BDP27DRAFT_842176 [Rhodocollybia butyracea]